ncbi:Flp family type IVb pilin [Piscinibacter sp. XHJ-5]|uniref:Flp family type IVb pilin n=1 Tax=Piscinibacter sp. XHJ-5 TaxID=3037797 RepID=UPI002453365E|nr:Flp family type IVb pilin [Piscinibacter sp. XHJ-5]
MDSKRRQTALHDAATVVSQEPGWWTDERGVTAVEYGLLAALITIACLAGFTSLSTAFSDLWTKWIIPVLAAV